VDWLNPTDSNMFCKLPGISGAHLGNQRTGMRSTLNRKILKKSSHRSFFWWSTRTGRKIKQRRRTGMRPLTTPTDGRGDRLGNGLGERSREMLGVVAGCGADERRRRHEPKAVGVLRETKVATRAHILRNGRACRCASQEEFVAYGAQITGLQE
jgi:hypothetical protein